MYAYIYVHIYIYIYTYTCRHDHIVTSAEKEKKFFTILDSDLTCQSFVWVYHWCIYIQICMIIGWLLYMHVQIESSANIYVYNCVYIERDTVVYMKCGKPNDKPIIWRCFKKHTSKWWWRLGMVFGSGFTTLFTIFELKTNHP